MICWSLTQRPDGVGVRLDRFQHRSNEALRMRMVVVGAHHMSAETRAESIIAVGVKPASWTGNPATLKLRGDALNFRSDGIIGIIGDNDLVGLRLLRAPAFQTLTQPLRPVT